MYSIPENLQEFIILNSIILKKNNNGWEKVHSQLKNSKTYLKQTDYIYDGTIKYETAIRMPSICLYDVFSMDEHGNYLDDMCDEIMYW
jgi:hypothetical protein